MISCKKCGKEFDDSKPDTNREMEYHHKVPKCIGGTDKNGRVYLCNKCHHVWHNMIPKFIFKYVPEDKKEECRHFVKRMCDWFISKK